MKEVLAIATLIVFGVMLANVIANPTGTKVVFDGVSSLWSTSINGLLGKTAK